jgi:dihydroflavonol-4-reductase
MKLVVMIQNVQEEVTTGQKLWHLEVIKSINEGLDAVLLCPSEVIGPYDYKLSQMANLFIAFIKGDLKVDVGGVYDFVYVRDVAKGIILSCKKGNVVKATFYLVNRFQYKIYFWNLKKLLE